MSRRERIEPSLGAVDGLDRQEVESNTRTTTLRQRPWRVVAWDWLQVLVLFAAVVAGALFLASRLGLVHVWPA